MNLRKDHLHYCCKFSCIFLWGVPEAQASRCHTLVMTFLEAFVSYGLRSQSLNTFSGGCLGSSSDEERSEARYAWRCAEIRDLKVFECTAPCGYARGTSGSASRYDFSVCLNIRGGTIAHHRESCGVFSLLIGMWDPILVMTLSLSKGPTPGILCPQEGTPSLG